MRHNIKLAQQACDDANARQAILVLFDGRGAFAVVSYGETRAECRAVRVTCDAIANALTSGAIPAPVKP